MSLHLEAAPSLFVYKTESYVASDFVTSGKSHAVDSHPRVWLRLTLPKGDYVET